MKARRLWVCLGGGLCLSAALLVQRTWGQQGLPLPPVPPGSMLPPPATLEPTPFAPPSAGPITVPSKQIELPAAPPLTPSTPNAAPPTLPAPTIPSAPSTAPVGMPASDRIIEAPPTPPVPKADLTFPPRSSSSGYGTRLDGNGMLPVDNVKQGLESFQGGSTGQTSTSMSPFRAPELTTGDTRPGKQEPAVSVEWIGAANARFNQPTNYQILVRNSGNATVHQVTVKPSLPEGAVIKASDPILPNGSDGGWSVGTLAPGQVRKIDVTILSQKRGYQNYAATVFFAASATHLAEVREPLLQIKMKAPDKALVGEPAPITFTISNPGDGTTENVKIRAILPEGLEHPRGQTFEIDAGNLAPKETKTLQLACMAKAHGQMKATLIAMADGSLNATDAATFDLLLPRLDLVLNGPKLRFVERPARYTMKVSNPGSAPAQGVMLNELVPAGFKFASASNQGKYDEVTRTVSWQIGDLPPGQTREITLDLIPTVPGDHRLAAAVQSSKGIRNESAVQTRVEGLSNLILEVSNADNPVEVGADATYEIRLANGGTKAETNVELVCSLPDSCDFRDARCAAGSKFRTENRDVIFEALPRLAPRGEVIYRVTVKGRLPGDVRFRARVRADGMADALIREETTKFYDDNAVR